MRNETILTNNLREDLTGVRFENALLPDILRDVRSSDFPLCIIKTDQTIMVKEVRAFNPVSQIIRVTAIERFTNNITSARDVAESTLNTVIQKILTYEGDCFPNQNVSYFETTIGSHKVSVATTTLEVSWVKLNPVT